MRSSSLTRLSGSRQPHQALACPLAPPCSPSLRLSLPAATKPASHGSRGARAIPSAALRVEEVVPSVLRTALRVAYPWARHEAVTQTVKAFYTDLTREAAERLLAPDFSLHEAGHERSFSKEEYIRLMYDTVLPAIPDFKWCHVSNYDLDEDGFTLVTVQACGHHTGKAFNYPGLPAIPASGRHFMLEEEAQMVRVHGGQIKEVKVFPVQGAGPRALYTALAGETPGPEAAKVLAREQMPLP